MSNKENLSTRDLREGRENFKIWKKEIFALLMQENLIGYILNEKLIKKDGSTISEDERAKSIAILDQTDTYYAVGTKKEVILADAKVRNILIRSVSINLIEDIDFESLTSYEIYQSIIETCVRTEEEWRNEIKDYLNYTKFDPEGEKHISLFISNFKQKFKELEKLKAKPSEDDKFNYLYRAMPIELAKDGNMLQFQKDLNGVIENLIQSYNKLKEIRKLDEIYGNKNNKTDTSPVSNSSKVQVNYNQPRTKGNNNFNISRKDIECWYCSKKGHFKRECWNKKSNNDYKKRKNYNNKKNNKNYQKRKKTRREARSNVKTMRLKLMKKKISTENTSLKTIITLKKHNLMTRQQVITCIKHNLMTRQQVFYQ